MFKDVIEKTEFNSVYAKDVLGRIRGESYMGDVTFLSTLRALVFDRMNDGDKINLIFSGSNYSKNTCDNNPNKAVIRALYDSDVYNDGDIVVHSVYGDSDSNDSIFEILEDFEEYSKGFEKIQKVTDFFRKTFRVNCYVNHTERKVVIFVEQLNIRRMHYLQCAILAFLPWYFNPEDGVTQDEMDLIQSLRETKPDKYMEAIGKIAEKYDLRTMFIKTRLSGFEVAYEKNRRNVLKERIADRISDIEDIKYRLSEILNRKREDELTLAGIELKISQKSEDSEIVEYFLCNKKLSLQKVNGAAMEFVVKDYLTYYDEEMAKRIIDNKTSYVYYPGSVVADIISPEDMETLMKEIFIEQNLRMRMCCAYRVEMGTIATGIAGYSYGCEFDDCIPNPHIDRYNCLGDYERTMNERLSENDIIGVIEQCISSCKSLNFADSAVMNVFMKRLYGVSGYKNNKCIELPNGDVVTPVNAVKWLKEQK